MTENDRPTTLDDTTTTADLNDGYGPDESLPGLVDALQDKVLHEEDNLLLEVEKDADAVAVDRDPKHDGDEAQPPV